MAHNYPFEPIDGVIGEGAIAALKVFELGLPLCIAIGFFCFCEGLPILRNIACADRIPLIREVLTGRVASEQVKAAADARRAYVDAGEKAALAAQLGERERQDRAGKIVLEDYRRRLSAAQRAASDELEREISDH